MRLAQRRGIRAGPELAARGEAWPIGDFGGLERGWIAAPDVPY